MSLISLIFCCCKTKLPKSEQNGTISNGTSNNQNNMSNLNIKKYLKKKTFKFKKLTNMDEYDSDYNTSQFNLASNITNKDRLNDSSSSFELMKDKNIFKQLRFVIILLMLFFYGGLVSNFILFMNNYFISILSVDSFYQTEFIYKAFFLSLIASRLINFSLLNYRNNRSIHSNSLIRNSHLSSQTGCFYRIKHLFGKHLMIDLMKRHKLICFLIIKLFFLSLFQYTSSHFIDKLNIINYYNKLMNSNSTNLSVSIKDTDNEFKLSLHSILIFGVIYPFLIGSFQPHLLDLIQDKQITSINFNLSNNLINKLNILVWASIIIGSFTLSFTNNYLIQHYKTQNIFIYSNLFNTFFLLVLLITLAFLKHSSSNVKRFISLNTLNTNIVEDDDDDDEDDDNVINENKRLRSYKFQQNSDNQQQSYDEELDNKHNYELNESDQDDFLNHKIRLKDFN